MADFWTIKFTVYRAAPQRGSDPNAIRAPFLLPILCHACYNDPDKSGFMEAFGMGKDLSKMTLEELWALFPIFLVPHDDRWKDSFNEIRQTLTGLLAAQPVVRISHIGSTAIQGIWAKNIVDVMIEIPQSADMKDIAQLLEQSGFTVMYAEANRISLNKGYTENGFADKVYHIHLRYAGDNDELYFRDYLNEHPAVAKEYETLKLRLWKQYEHDRDAYTDAKTDFISKWTAEARKEYGDRY